MRGAIKCQPDDLCAPQVPQITTAEAPCSGGQNLFQIKSMNVIIHNSLFVYQTYSKAERKCHEIMSLGKCWSVNGLQWNDLPLRCLKHTGSGAQNSQTSGKSGTTPSLNCPSGVAPNTTCHHSLRYWCRHGCVLIQIQDSDHLRQRITGLGGLKVVRHRGSHIV
jgi:hypothetical protein